MFWGEIGSSYFKTPFMASESQDDFAFLYAFVLVSELLLVNENRTGTFTETG
jgi:hypothetical protein